MLPRSVTEKVESSQLKQLEEVEVGDVLVVSPDTSSEVIGFTHHLSNSRMSYSLVRLAVSGQEQTLATVGHYIYVNDELRAIDEA